MRSNAAARQIGAADEHPDPYGELGDPHSPPDPYGPPSHPLPDIRDYQQTPTSDKVTAVLIPKAAADLQAAIAESGRNKTDIINRAISLYRFVTARLAAGDELLIRRQDGQVEQIRIF